MKKLFSLFTVLGALALMPVRQASAYHHGRDGRLSGYTPCGKPIYAYHEVVGHDHCGRNIWEWVTHYPSSCHCRDHHRDSGRSYSRHGYHRPSGWNSNIRF